MMAGLPPGVNGSLLVLHVIGQFCDVLEQPQRHPCKHSHSRYLGYLKRRVFFAVQIDWGRRECKKDPTEVGSISYSIRPDESI